MKTVIISPFSQKMRNGERNPKNFPDWANVIKLLRGISSMPIRVIQVGVHGEEDIGADERHNNLPLKKLEEVLRAADTWAGVDNFFQHFATFHKKKGVVIFGKSDPKIFGHPQNINLLKDRSYLRERQYSIWEEEKWEERVWVSAQQVCESILGLLR